jgi:hypothetical protein
MTMWKWARKERKECWYRKRKRKLWEKKISLSEMELLFSFHFWWRAEKYLKSCLDQIACVGTSASFGSFHKLSILVFKSCSKCREEERALKKGWKRVFCWYSYLIFESLMDSSDIINHHCWWGYFGNFSSTSENWEHSKRALWYYKKKY